MLAEVKEKPVAPLLNRVQSYRIIVFQCKSYFFHSRNIFKIRKFVSVNLAKTRAHAFITSKVNYCNSLR